jgi:hypothetical protein
MRQSLVTDERKRRRKRSPAERQLARQRSLDEQRHTLDQLHIAHDDQVLTFKQWCALNALSERTGARILDPSNSDKPKVLQLSEHRIGIRVRDNRAWQETRGRV